MEHNQPDREWHMDPVEINFDETHSIMVNTLDICMGCVIEPGHDCDREDHHTARKVDVVVFRIKDYDTDEFTFVMFPKDSSFISDLLDGSLRVELLAWIARFEEKNPLD